MLAVLIDGKALLSNARHIGNASGLYLFLQKRRDAVPRHIHAVLFRVVLCDEPNTGFLAQHPDALSGLSVNGFCLVGYAVKIFCPRQFLTPFPEVYLNDFRTISMISDVIEMA